MPATKRTCVSCDATTGIKQLKLTKTHKVDVCSSCREEIIEGAAALSTASA